MSGPSRNPAARTVKPWLLWLGIGAGLLIAISVVYVAVNDSGTITVHYADSAQPYHQQIKTSLEQWGGFETAATELNSALLLPKNLEVWFADCGQSNALYNRETRQVVLCYELITDLIRGFAPYAQSDTALTAAVWHTTFFVFYHEIGHALIHILDLPTTGREEDAVDQLATLVLLNGGDAGRDAALQGASWFAMRSRSGQPILFWDEHALDQQRYYNIICWVYGSNPQAYQALLQPAWGLPEARAADCPAEFQHISKAWHAVLEGHTL